MREAAEIFGALGFPAGISADRFIINNKNLAAGDIEKAQYLFAAHYDTPFRMFVPINVIYPKSIVLSLLYQLFMLALLFAAAVALAIGINALIPLGKYLFMLPLWIWVVSVALSCFCFPNKHNVNDNTSGVIAIMRLAHALPASIRERAAFILFDNEELGLFGSAAFANANGKKIRGKTVINMDCVGVGDDIVFLANREAAKDEAVMGALNTPPAGNRGKRVIIGKGKGWFYPSDQANFKKSIAVAAFKRGPFGLYLNDIHMDCDRYLDSNNIELIVQCLIPLVTGRTNA